MWVVFVILLIGALLWLGPILLVREFIDRVSGQVGVVSKSLDQRVDAELKTLKSLSRSDLIAHPQKCESQDVVVSGRRATLTWNIDPIPPWNEGETTVVLWHELRFFNFLGSPKSHGAAGFKILATGDRIDLTGEELLAYT